MVSTIRQKRSFGLANTMINHFVQNCTNVMLIQDYSLADFWKDWWGIWLQCLCVAIRASNILYTVTVLKEKHPSFNVTGDFLPGEHRLVADAVVDKLSPMIVGPVSSLKLI